MTDPGLADATYIEPITSEYIEKIIIKEKPDAILPTLGGQTALNAAIDLYEKGILDKYNVELLGAKVESIKKAESREQFSRAMDKIDLKVPKGKFVHSLSDAKEFIEENGFPVILRPSFTLGGTGGGTAYNIEEFESILNRGLEASMTREVLIERSLFGWKEFELEVMRDKNDNFVVICSIENFDPMGVHTGDSITVAPQQTLTDRQYQELRDAAKKVISEIGVETGGSNIQFAVNPENGDFVVIEMNPRVSRSSALASKATGFPIAKIAAKLAVGYTLDEIPNDITRTTPSCFEPVMDYVVVKIPRWDFDKFRSANTQSDVLGVQMKSVGEVMSFGRNFKEAFQKAIRSLEIGRSGLGADGKDIYDSEMLINVKGSEKAALKEKFLTKLKVPRSDNIFYLRYALLIGCTIEEIHNSTKIDNWFLFQIQEIIEMEKTLLSYTF
jgi:carbamoyl-phosphate synthase large subunit